MKKLAMIAAAILLAPGVAAAADLSGAWKLNANANDMPLVIDCNFTQTGAALTGTCGLEGPDKPSPVTGTVDGNTAKWAYDVTFQDMPLHVALTATTTDTTMTGAMDVAGMSIPFTAKKQ